MARVLGPLAPAILLHIWNAAAQPVDDAEAPADESTAQEKVPPAAHLPEKHGGWKFGGSLRARVELWDWFDPGSQGGTIIRSIYPAGSNGSLAYWELARRF